MEGGPQPAPCGAQPCCSEAAVPLVLVLAGGQQEPEGGARSEGREEGGDSGEVLEMEQDLPSTAGPGAAATPSDATATPSDTTATPSDATATPSDATATPSDATTTPPDATATPSDATATPSDATATPSDATTTPSDATVTPSDAAATPSDATATPADATHPGLSTADATHPGLSTAQCSALDSTDDARGRQSCSPPAADASLAAAMAASQEAAGRHHMPAAAASARALLQSPAPGRRAAARDDTASLTNVDQPPLQPQPNIFPAFGAILKGFQNNSPEEILKGVEGRGPGQADSCATTAARRCSTDCGSTAGLLEEDVAGAEKGGEWYQVSSGCGGVGVGVVGGGSGGRRSSSGGGGSSATGPGSGSGAAVPAHAHVSKHAVRPVHMMMRPMASGVALSSSRYVDPHRQAPPPIHVPHTVLHQVPGQDGSA